MYGVLRTLCMHTSITIMWEATPFPLAQEASNLPFVRTAYSGRPPTTRRHPSGVCGDGCCGTTRIRREEKGKGRLMKRREREKAKTLRVNHLHLTLPLVFYKVVKYYCNLQYTVPTFVHAGYLPKSHRIHALYRKMQMCCPRGFWNEATVVGGG